VQLEKLFGLDEFGIAVYRAAAGHRYSDIESLAEWVGQPVERVEAEVHRQLQRGLLRLVGDTWEAQDPTLVLEAEHATERVELEASRSLMVGQRAALYQSGLFADYLAGRRRPGAQDRIVTILDQQKILLKILELVENAETQVHFLLGGPSPAGPGQVQFIQDLVWGMARAVERGVRVASVWAPEYVAAARAASGTRRLPSFGWVRQSTQVPMRAVAVDVRTAVLPVDPDDLDRGALVLEAPSLLTILTDMIERIHRDAEPLAAPAQAADPAVQRRQNAVLALLAQGHTDHVIAAELGVTIRTVRRDVADLYDAHHVTSRFELGAVTASLGLLPPIEV
jgi:DNA-binding CsgD family transcriptional regulator